MASSPSTFKQFAIPNVHRALAMFTALVFVLTLINEEFTAVLFLDPGSILRGEVWRVFTGFLLPGLGTFGGSGNLVFEIIILIIKVQLLIFMGDALQNAWGVRRFNAMFFGTILSVNVSSFIAHSINPVMGSLLGITTFIFLFLTIYFSFAAEYPDYEFLLMFVLPVKAKWIAILIAVITVYRGFTIARGFENIYPLVHVILCFTPFLIIALPRLLNYSKQVHRRSSFKRKVERNPASGKTQAFHTCSACHITDTKDPSRQFRVLDNGEEICLPCLEKRQSAD